MLAAECLLPVPVYFMAYHTWSCSSLNKSLVQQMHHSNHAEKARLGSLSSSVLDLLVCGFTEQPVRITPI